MISDAEGMKVLLVDKSTVMTVSAAYSQSEILQQEVFLVEQLGDGSEEEMRHMKVRAAPAVCAGRRYAGGREQRGPHARAFLRCAKLGLPHLGLRLARLWGVRGRAEACRPAAWGPRVRHRAPAADS